ncbi:hypothetical protein Tco_1333473, partial [Tanacetum coccineum]
MAASCSSYFPTLMTFVLGARPAIRAAAAFPALFSLNETNGGVNDCWVM